MIWSSNWRALCYLSNWVNKGFIKCFCYFSWILCRYHLNCLLALLGFLYLLPEHFLSSISSSFINAINLNVRRNLQHLFNHLISENLYLSLSLQGPARFRRSVYKAYLRLSFPMNSWDTFLYFIYRYTLLSFTPVSNVFQSFCCAALLPFSKFASGKSEGSVGYEKIRRETGARSDAFPFSRLFCFPETACVIYRYDHKRHCDVTVKHYDELSYGT